MSGLLDRTDVALIIPYHAHRCMYVLFTCLRLMRAFFRPNISLTASGRVQRHSHA